MSDLLKRLHQQARQNGEQAYALALNKKRGEITSESVDLNYVSHAVSSSRSGGTSPTDIGELSGRGVVEMASHESRISSLILRTLGTGASIDSGSDKFTRNSPVIIKVVIGLGDPLDSDASEIQTALEKMQRVRQYSEPDEEGRSVQVLELVPVEIYCIKYEIAGAPATESSGFQGLGMRAPGRTYRPPGSPGTHRSEKITMIIKTLSEVNDDFDMISPTRTILGDDARPLVRELQSMMVTLDGRPAHGMMRSARVYFMPSLSAIRGDVDDPEAEEMIQQSLYSGTAALNRIIPEERASGKPRQIVYLADRPISG